MTAAWECGDAEEMLDLAASMMERQVPAEEVLTVVTFAQARATVDLVRCLDGIGNQLKEIAEGMGR